jgi:hypothetical protein
MERIRRRRAVGGRVGERADDLQPLDDRAGSPVRDDERQRIIMARPNMNEMNVKPIDFSPLPPGLPAAHRLVTAPVWAVPARGTVSA